jgi:hypothetical protein
MAAIGITNETTLRTFTTQTALCCKDAAGKCCSKATNEKPCSAQFRGAADNGFCCMSETNKPSTQGGGMNGPTGPPPKPTGGPGPDRPGMSGGGAPA